MKPVHIEVTNNSLIDRTFEPVSIGVPISKGVFFDKSDLCLIDQDDFFVPCQINVLARWGDLSLKWVYLNFQANVKGNTSTVFKLLDKDKYNRSTSALTDFGGVLKITDSEDVIQVDTGKAKFMLDKHLLKPFGHVSITGTKAPVLNNTHVILKGHNGRYLKPVINSTEITDLADQLFNKIILKGDFIDEHGNQGLKFTMVMSFFAGKSTVKCDFTVTNPRAARHQKGVWDLGDSGSFFFDSLKLELPFENKSHDIHADIRITADSTFRPVEGLPIKIYQDSSGGTNWQSNNHVNFEGVVKNSFKGYRFYINDKLMSEGDRAEPVLYARSNYFYLSTFIPDFWQNFPKALTLEEQSIFVHLFPDDYSDCYELQGGEQKTHSFYLDVNDEYPDLSWCTDPLEIKMPLDVYTDSACVPFLSNFYEETDIQKLILRGIQGDNNFFEKREDIDEFGWRNYGDIYADHEIHEYKGSEPLISHYNNQYDALNGLLKQYLMTGNRKWYELAAPLAKHIIDIDIYHTDEDRDEYVGGLFWHTDHYLSAHTSTHRTFSAKHADDYLYGEIGGGPGGEHCYTTGLMNMYFMTNDFRYKESVLELTDWMTRLYEGSGTILERIYQFKNRDLPNLKKLISGETVQKYKYPFTRGTGNYITALLDANILTGDKEYLSRVETIIRDTIHPNDVIEKRHLNDIENSWSYLILLQSIARYLEEKSKENEYDSNFFYARDSFIHYVDWIAENEKPFLDQSELLEFPNHTWVAQDLRKANLLKIAAMYHPGRGQKYKEKSTFFTSYVSKTLGEETTRYYARILIILMQNDINLIDDRKSSVVADNNSHNYKFHNQQPPKYSIPSIIFTFVMDIVKRVIHVSWEKEKRWLSYRLNS